MHTFLTLAACLLLGACASNPQATYQQDVLPGSSPMANSALEAIHTPQAIPLPLNPGLLAPQWPISADEPRLDFGSSISNYRIFSLRLKKGEHYSLNVRSLCNKPCMGVSKFALKPRAMLLDAYGTVIASQPSRTSFGIDRLTLGWAGEAREDGPYYLLVAAAPGDSGKTLVIDDIWINNSPLMALKFRSGH